MSAPVKVQIFGQSYPIGTELPQEYVQKLAAYVDEKMHAIADATGVRVRELPFTGRRVNLNLLSMPVNKAGKLSYRMAEDAEQAAQRPRPRAVS